MSAQIDAAYLVITLMDVIEEARRTSEHYTFATLKSALMDFAATDLADDLVAYVSQNGPNGYRGRIGEFHRMKNAVRACTDRNCRFCDKEAAR